ncbi:unnamed protein product, partial [Mesorhabditis belari]|uniref:EGF-like domain-containing protein n=1 Tax=Mesorhabditis belari TaxID=2138241 RepID=A0AAF3FIS0_9BILA
MRLLLLTRLTDIDEGCDRSAQHGFGIVDGFVEHCERYNKAQFNNSLQAEYEAWRCTHLRLKGQLTDGVCKCMENWYGAFCHLSALCDKGDNKTSRAWFQGKCIPNACYHGGDIAVGKNMVECTCPVPWDGRLCERLACWRKTQQHFEKRFRNVNSTECICGDHYTGKDCDQIISCLHGNFTQEVGYPGRCDCEYEWFGEICDRRKTCTLNKETNEKVCSTGMETSFLFSSLLSLTIFSLFFRS